MADPNLSLDGTWGLDNIFGKGIPTIFSNSSGYTDASNGKADETKLKDLNYMLGQADYYNALNPTQSLQYLGNSGYSRRHFAKTLQKGVRNSNWVDLNSDLLSQLKALGIDSEDSFNEFKGLGASGRWKLAKKALINANNNAFQQHAVQTRLDELIKNNLLFLSGLAAPVQPVLPVQPEKPYTYNGIKEGVTDWNGNAEKIFGILGNDFVKLNVDTNGDGKIDLIEYDNFLQGLGQGRNFSDGKYGNASINGIINKYGITGDLLTQLQGLITKPNATVAPPPPVSSENDYVIINGQKRYANNPADREAWNAKHNSNKVAATETDDSQDFKFTKYGDNWWLPRLSSAEGTNWYLDVYGKDFDLNDKNGNTDLNNRNYNGGLVRWLYRDPGVNRAEEAKKAFYEDYAKRNPFTNTGDGEAFANWRSERENAFNQWFKNTTGNNFGQRFKQGGKLITKKYK